ncbi:MAG: MBL fold metallo-hydrolase [Anaerolineae bacterium]|nr:MBL fold metallo-hydrolase [Anaerolineae bacterium]
MRRLTAACWLILVGLAGLLGAGCAGSASLPASGAPTAQAAAAHTLPATTRPSAVPATARPTPTLAPPGTARITVLYDNVPFREGLQTAWGYACLVETGEATILFDTGGDGALLLGNMAALGTGPEAIDIVVLSHAHTDHTGGLAALLAAGARPAVYLPASFADAVKAEVASQTALVEVTGPAEVAPGAWTTGELGTGIVEQALAVQTGEGITVITGCAHPGVVAMVRAAQQVAGGEVALVVGGFHLEDAGEAEIERTIQGLRALGVRRVAPSHCTGETARRMFAEAFGDACLTAGAGWTITVGLP